MKRVFFMLAAWCICMAMHAQFSVSGRVSDNNHEALSGVNVTLKGTAKGFTTNEQGEFYIRSLKSGNYVLVFSYIGYQSVEIEIALTKNERVDLSLSPLPYLGHEAVIVGQRADRHTPWAFETLNKEAINERNNGQDIPVLLNTLTSVVATTDAGTGIGYTGLRIRGTDLNRINVTINGIPYNDAESHSVYMVDLPDFASTTNSIQVQRGVGTSSNGAAAFGATINLQTNTLNMDPYATADLNYGSFNTKKATTTFGTGISKKGFTLDGRLSKIESDGYIDRAWADLKSFYLSAGYHTGNTIVRANIFSGIEKTYQAWNGVPKVRLNNDIQGMKRYADHGLYSDAELVHMLASDSRRYNLYTYENEIDHYQQDHYQLHLSTKPSDELIINASLFYTYGNGYYEQYRKNRKLSDYNMPKIEIGDTAIQEIDLIRQKWLDNDFYGMTANIVYKINRATSVFGAGLNRYEGDHFGQVIWARHTGATEKGHEWYRNKGLKNDFNLFGRINLNPMDKINLFADLQYRGIRYNINGIDDNLDSLNFSGLNFDFFNPKAGIVYSPTKSQSAYLSFAVANREPNRSNYTDAPAERIPVPERLYNTEFGYRLSLSNLSANINLYHMYYINQLVLTGEINDVGDPIMVNVPFSFRRGIEIAGQFRLMTNLDWSGNLTLSQNRINNFEVFVTHYENWADTSLGVMRNTTLSFSPSVVASSMISYSPVNGMQIYLTSKYVSRQYIDNTQSVERSLNPYLINDLMCSYSFAARKASNVTLKFGIYNILNRLYETNAWVWRYSYEDELYEMDGYFPQAGRNYYVGLNVKL